MKDYNVNPGSFRDSKGQILEYDNRIIRLVYAEGANDYEFVRDTGFYRKLINMNQLVNVEEINSINIQDELFENTKYVLEHPRLEFISYPYEWPFLMLQSAALFQLDLYIKALENGITLSDASAFNIQFLGPRPVFIDHLSFRPYKAGEYWLAHRQFCEQFLNPLLFYSVFGIPYHYWYRGSMEGLKTTELNRLLPFSKKMSPVIFFHVTMQAYFQNKKSNNDKFITSSKLPLQSFQNMIHGLKNQISRLRVRNNISTDWEFYANKNSYSLEESNAKHQFIKEYVEKVRPKMIWDLGCNTGEYSVTALKSGAETAIGFDSDHRALDAGYERALKEGLNFLPLYMDITNPSPSQGWSENERGGLSVREKPDGIIALALLHHLVIGRNIPLNYVINWILNLAPSGIIEFVPKNDPMVKQLLAHREEIFSGYTLENILNQINLGSRIIKKETITENGRILIWYESTN